MTYLKRVSKVLSAALVICMFMATPVKAGENDTYICDEYQTYIYEVANSYNVCPELIMAIIEAESSGNAKAINDGSHCIGLMQVSSKWHKDRMERLGVTDLYDPYSNILVGTDYLMELAEEYGDLGTVLMIYNGTKNAVERGESANYTKYAIKIINRSYELERIHNK